jgi:DNA-binding NtrC family response regulator
MPHILVVDDDSNIRNLLSMALRPDYACRITTASDGCEALAFLDAIHPDLVVSDTQMPRIDGISLACPVIARGIPFILMTGDPTLQQQLRAAEWPFLQKPFRISELFTLVRRTLGEAEANVRGVGRAIERLHLQGRDAG